MTHENYSWKNSSSPESYSHIYMSCFSPWLFRYPSPRYCSFNRSAMSFLYASNRLLFALVFPSRFLTFCTVVLDICIPLSGRISWLFHFCSLWWPIYVWPCWCTAPSLMYFCINRVDLWYRLVHNPYECVLWHTWMFRNHQLCSSTQFCVPSTCLSHKLYHHVMIPNLPWLTRLVVLSSQGHHSLR